MNPSFWKGKRVLLTGHTGFKGSWLALWLQSAGAEVHGIALPPEGSPNLFEKARVGEGMSSVYGDIRDPASVKKAMMAAKPEIVLHLAAQALVRPSYSDPVGTYATNVMGTTHVLDSMRRSSSVRVAIMVTTDKCYENTEVDRGYRETDPLGGHDPYSSSKACAEIAISSYRRSFFYPKGSARIASARAGNVIGGGDWSEDRLVPDLIRAFSKGRATEIRNPQSTRPWQHVLEPVGAYLMLAEKLWNVHGERFATAWNFGPADEDAKPVGWIADTLTELWGEGASWKRVGGEHPHEARFLKLDCTRARTELNWAPKWNVKQALARTVDWYREDLSGRDMREYSLKQIEQYLAATSGR